MAQVQLFPGVVVDIIDNTTLEGLQPSTLTFLRAAGEAALASGLAYIQVTAGAGSDGHVSHYDGTEADIVGFNPDGSRWSQDQRVAVATGARGAGANRFGFYSNPDGSFSGNSLHIGTGPNGQNQNITWGYGGATSGDASRAFTFPGEANFAASMGGATPSAGAVTAGSPTAPGTAENRAPEVVPNTAPEPETPIQSVVRSIGAQMANRQPAAAPERVIREPTGPLMAAMDLENSRSRLGQMRSFLIPEPENVSTVPQPVNLAREGSEGPLGGPKKPDFGAQSGFSTLFRGAKPAPLGGGIRVRG